MYILLHIALGILYVVLGMFTGSFALKTLIALYKSPEMLKSQRAIWLPILVGMLFFAIGGVAHLAEHTFWTTPEANLSHEITVVTGLLITTIGVLRYSFLQLEYYRLKARTIKKMQFQESIEQISS